MSYAELAPHLAQRIGVLQNAVDDGAFDARELTEHLLLDFHRAICGDLTPAFAGRWRSTDVRVGDHEPPPAHQVASLMREFVRDLAARLEHLPQPPDALWLEALAFAEGRLLSIHPFADFNGRVARVFSGWLARRLALPEIELTPEAGEATDRYLAALRAADRRKWQPLMEIWRERIEQGAR